MKIVIIAESPQVFRSVNQYTQVLEENQLKHQAWLLRKEACRNRIVENFSIEKMIDGYHQLWSSK